MCEVSRGCAVMVSHSSSRSQKNCLKLSIFSKLRAKEQDIEDKDLMFFATLIVVNVVFSVNSSPS